MIGVFDSGIGGLTVLRALAARFPETAFVYLGDHANVPYGNRSSTDIVDLTRAGVEALFGRGAGLVVLGCNTATAVAAAHVTARLAPGVALVRQPKRTRHRSANRRGRDADAVGGDEPAVSAEIQYRRDRRLRHAADDIFGRLSRGDRKALSAGKGHSTSLRGASRRHRGTCGRRSARPPRGRRRQGAGRAERRGAAAPRYSGLHAFSPCRRDCSGVICRLSRACCRSLRSSPTVSITISSGIRNSCRRAKRVA